MAMRILAHPSRRESRAIENLTSASCHAWSMPEPAQQRGHAGLNRSNEAQVPARLVLTRRRKSSAEHVWIGRDRAEAAGTVATMGIDMEKRDERGDGARQVARLSSPSRRAPRTRWRGRCSSSWCSDCERHGKAARRNFARPARLVGLRLAALRFGPLYIDLAKEHSRLTECCQGSLGPRPADHAPSVIARRRPSVVTDMVIAEHHA